MQGCCTLWSCLQYKVQCIKQLTWTTREYPSQSLMHQGSSPSWHRVFQNHNFLWDASVQLTSGALPAIQVGYLDLHKNFLDTQSLEKLGLLGHPIRLYQTLVCQEVWIVYALLAWFTGYIIFHIVVMYGEETTGQCILLVVSLPYHCQCTPLSSKEPL